MVFEPDERLKKKMDRDGSVLKYMYGVAGVGLGLMAGGGMLAVVGVLLILMLWSVDMRMALRLGGAFTVFGLLVAAAGMTLQNRRMNRWLHVYCKKTGLSEEEIRRADAEFKQPGVTLFAFEKGKNSNSLKKMGFITPNYIKFPGIGPSLARLDDLVACFYTKKYLCQDGGYDKALAAYTRDKKLAFTITNPNEKMAQEIVDTIVKYNPMVIHHHHFQYGEKTYDAARDMDDVIRLHDQIRAERAGVKR